MRSAVFALSLGLGALAGVQTASASSVLATYYKVTAGGDFEDHCCSTSVEIGATLGPNGLPVRTGGETLTDLNANNELLWWTPDGSHVMLDGPPAIVPLPIIDDSVFTPQGTGGSNGGANGFQTIRLKGFFKTLLPSTNLTFNATSDDDIFLFIDGNYVDSDLDGIHGPTSDTFGTSVGAGLHTFDLFYADRHTTQAVLHFDIAGVDLRATVPEPATWAMMILGFGAAGAVLRRRRPITA